MATFQNQKATKSSKILKLIAKSQQTYKILCKYHYLIISSFSLLRGNYSKLDFYTKQTILYISKNKNYKISKMNYSIAKTYSNIDLSSSTREYLKKIFLFPMLEENEEKEKT